MPTKLSHAERRVCVPLLQILKHEKALPEAYLGSVREVIYGWDYLQSAPATTSMLLGEVFSRAKRYLALKFHSGVEFLGRSGLIHFLGAAKWWLGMTGRVLICSEVSVHLAELSYKGYPSTVDQ